MAKGNLFQGMARGKVGDVVFYRMNGVQMSRVRNRDPKNPRSNEQLYQRAIIATIMKAYSIGKEIYDHAFQGYTIGEGCMRRFNSVNARLLRENLITDISQNRPFASQHGRFVPPRSVVSVPVPGMQVSEGTLQQLLFGYSKAGLYTPSHPTFNLPASGINTVGDMYNYGQTMPGDLYTFIFHICNGSTIYTYDFEDSDYADVVNSEFYWVRLTLKDVPASDPISTKTFADLFEIETSNGKIKFDGSAKILETTDDLPIELPNDTGVYSIIRSRLDMDVRSTSYMHVFAYNSYGIASGYVLPIWQDMVQKVGTSELILEGGDGFEFEMKPNNMRASGFTETEVIDQKLEEIPTNEGGRKSARHRGTTNTQEG